MVEEDGQDAGELEEGEDISKNSAFGPASPSTPSTPMAISQSHKKSWVKNDNWELRTGQRKLNKILHISRETRAGNNLYQELSFQDTDALADIDEGADLTGNWGEMLRGKGFKA